MPAGHACTDRCGYSSTVTAAPSNLARLNTACATTYAAPTACVLCHQGGVFCLLTGHSSLAGRLSPAQRVQEFKGCCKAHGRELKAWPERERSTALRFFLHLADIANPCKPRQLSQEWSRRITEEFFRQVRAEGSAGLPCVLLLPAPGARRSCRLTGAACSCAATAGTMGPLCPAGCLVAPATGDTWPSEVF